MINVLNKTKDKLELIISGKISTNNATATNETASGRKKRKIAVIIFECHNLIDVLEEVTQLLKDGTDLANKAYEVTRIERKCEKIIVCEVTKEECEGEGKFDDLKTAKGKENFFKYLVFS